MAASARRAGTSLAGTRVLVTGAAGFLGRALVERLGQLGAAVVAVDRRAWTPHAAAAAMDGGRASNPNAPRPETDGAGAVPAAVVEGDLLELDLGSLVAGVAVVFHLAGVGGVSGSWGDAFPRYARENLLTTQRLLEALGVDGGGGKLVLASSSSVYGPLEPPALACETDACAPASPYGVTKLAAEQLVALYRVERGVHATACRLFTVYGPGQRPDMAVSRLIGAWRTGVAAPLHGGGAVARHFTYVDDAVDGLLQVATDGRPGGVYNVAGAGVHSVAEVVAELTRRLGSPVPVESVPLPPGLPRHTAADLRRAGDELGFVPRVGLAEGIARQVAWALDAASAPAEVSAGSEPQPER
jgi:nucleoside-diphosphate-sugar epimerase